MNSYMENLSKYLNTMDNFQYAINIGYDLYSDEKIRNYIPTESAIEIIEDIVLSTASSSTDRARILVGPYGKGKSHLALVLLAILCRNEDDLYSNILSYICRTKPELCEYIKDYHKRGSKLLPVVVQGGGMGIKQALLYGIKKSLEENGLSDFMPETYFKSAINAINSWKENYPTTYSQFVSSINCTVEEYVNKLNEYNASFYRDFVELYPSLTSGSDFNPVSGMDVISLYSEVSRKIKNRGYNGIYVIYDEFSKYLEGNIKNIAGDEIKALQDFAEFCNRSKDNQIHILLISHKSILNYIDDLSRTKIDAWKAVANRFKSIELSASTIQTYDLLSKVLTRDCKWFDSFKENNKTEFNKLINKWVDCKAFSEVDNETFEKLVYSCYPLSPVSLFILPRISEEIAQNERTLFTFMSSKSQKNTLPEFIKKVSSSKFDLITPDYIFDYFEPLFKAEPYDKPIHKYWKAATIALKKLSASQALEKKVIKTLALIYIVDRPDLLPPTVNVISDIFDLSGIRVSEEINNLQSSNLIRQLDNSNYLKIVEHSDVNINALISDETEKAKLKFAIKDILNDYIRGIVVYPNVYNDDNCVIRFFDYKFINASEILQGIDYNQELKQAQGDGIVYSLVNDCNNMADVELAISKAKENRIVFVISKFDDNVHECLYKYCAIKNYLKTCEDSIISEELSVSLADLQKLISRYVDSFLNPELGYSKYYINGAKQNIKRKSSLSGVLSSVFAEIFVDYPIINNEMINKNNISSQARNSRNKVVAGLLETTVKHNLGLKGSGQDVSIMRTTLLNKGMLSETESGIKIKVSNIPDIKLQRCLDIINGFVSSSCQNGGKSFAELYDLLQNPSNGIGLKKGVIPVYVAAILHYYKKYVAITKDGKELELSARLLDSINESPADFNIYIENWDQDKEQYIADLTRTFGRHVKKSEQELSNFDYVIKAVQRWFLELPKYSKESRKIYDGSGNLIDVDLSTIRFINLIKNPDVNAREVLFEKVLVPYGYRTFDRSIAGKIENSKALLDSAKLNLIKFITQKLRLTFAATSDEETLSSAVMNWYDSLSDGTKNHVFNDIESGLLEIVSSVTPDEVEFVERLARASTGLRIDDWAESTIDVFFDTINSFVETIDEYNKKDDSDKDSVQDGCYKISFINENGEETYKTFDATTYSGVANLMYSDVESMIDEYGEAVSKNEKRQILIDIINKLLS